MSSKAQKKALHNYRTRLSKQGLARFEVLGLDTDRDLIRWLAKKLANNDPEATQIRATVTRTTEGEPSRKGGILAAFRNSPMVGANLDLTRARPRMRKIDL